jgi:hypothetical protein
MIGRSLVHGINLMVDPCESDVNTVTTYHLKFLINK